MNFLFYVGIIIPTLITITLFLIFIYCWFLQKARKEVLTKKYDPHGKMRRLGMSMDPPPPPSFCRMQDSLLNDNGEDNVGYDVSRSPSTEQDARGRPLYHTYHDSGISAGLSPSQESEPRPGLAYRSCPDSGISGFGPQAGNSYHVGRTCCQVEEPLHRHPQQQCADHAQIHAHQQHSYHQQVNQHQAVLHHNLIQASVHPAHGVCYGDDMNHPQSPQHYNPPIVHPASLNLAHYNERQINLVAHIHTPPTQSSLINQQRPQFYTDSPGYQLHLQNDQHYSHASEITDHPQHSTNISPSSRPGQDNAATSTTADFQFSNRVVPLNSANFHPQSNLGSDTNSHQHPSASSSPTKLPRHSYRDTTTANTAQSTTINGTDRPDSQASQSSTTDSEDSGFRSSHCAAHPNARLSKQGNPLLKPFRRTKNNKAKLHKPALSKDEISRTNGATPLITLNPQNLQTNVDTSHVIQNTSLMALELAHRPTRIHQQTSNIRNNMYNDRVPTTSLATPQGDIEVFHDGSPRSPIRTHQHSPGREKWPPQSSNEGDTTVNQIIDLNDISTHLSWKYLQDISSSNNVYTATPNGGMVIQPCHQGIRPGQIQQNNQDQHMEMFGFSVV